MLAISDLRIDIAGKTIIRSVSAGFEPGSAALLVGANGVGKTTLLRALAGRIPCCSGSIEVNGERIDPQSVDWRRSRVLLEADGGHLDDFTPAEQLRLRATLLGLDKDEGESRSTALEAAFGFGRHRDLRASTLSTGFKRRLALALAFMSDAKIMLLDEPLNGLDVEGAAAFTLLLGAFTAAGGAAVIASHVTGPLLPVVDSIIEIVDGRLFPHEATEEFFRSYGRGQVSNMREDTERTFPWLAGRR